LTHLHRADKLARLMVAPRLQFISPLQLAERQERLTGTVAVSALTRLREILLDDNGRVTFDLYFDRDEQGHVFIKGSFSVNLVFRCQRCMQPMELVVEGKINLGVVNPDDDQDVSERYEPLTLVDNQIALETLLEEEILLAMPIAPVHERDSCKGSNLVDKYIFRPESPFAVLKNLKIEK